MSDMDPAKLKVVELRAELTARGLDAKGNKPVLVQRLKEALEKELKKEIPDTSIADTSTEDFDMSQEKIVDTEFEPIVPEIETEDSVQSAPVVKEPSPVKESPPKPQSPQKQPPKQSPSKPQPEPAKESPQKAQSSPSKQSPQKSQPHASPAKESTKSQQQPSPEKPIPAEVEEETPQETEPPKTDVEVTQENGDHVQDEGMQVDEAGEKDGEKKSPQQRGDKRRRSSLSPDRSQVKRSRSPIPIKEDEPVIDSDKVQLSWFDSDLHLQVDKESFLSGKPYHEGGFGYAWAGVRATHGIGTGKACFEVKITEELKFEDVVMKQIQNPPRKGGKNVDRPKGYQKESVKEKDDESKQEEAGESKMEEDGESKNEEPEDASKQEGDVQVQTEAAEMEVDEVKVGEVGEQNIEAKEEVTDDKAEDDRKESNGSAVEGDAEESRSKDDVEPEVPIEAPPTHLFRVGWSVVDAALQLGETKNSFGYESSAKFVTNKEFVDYGIKFGVGDVVAAYVEINDQLVEFTFAVNGEAQTTALSIPRSEFPEENFVLFPHVLSRNFGFQLNFGNLEEPLSSHPAGFESYKFVQSLEDKVPGPTRPAERSECEVIMMCGLPASGKTHWVREWVQNNPDKRYTVIGNSFLLEKMTINGNPLKDTYKSRWSYMLDKLMKCLNTLVEVASTRRRNFVIDQTNVFPSAQRRKMRSFEGFKRRAVVLIVGDEEQAKRQKLQEDNEGGKDVPDSSLLEMKANMVLPETGDWLEEITFTELPETEAKAEVEKYNKEGKDAGYGYQPRGRGDYRGNQFRWNPNSSRRDYYRDNRFQNNRFDKRFQGGWQNRRPVGNWNRDVRRDNRGPPQGGQRDWRSNRPGDRRDQRDNRNRPQSGNSNNFNRAGGGRGQGWQQGGNRGNWQGGQGGWNSSQGWNQGGNWQGGYGYGQQQGYNANWNYYGSYPQNWNNQS